MATTTFKDPFMRLPVCLELLEEDTSNLAEVSTKARGDIVETEASPIPHPLALS